MNQELTTKERNAYPITKGNLMIQTSAFNLTSLEHDVLNYIIMKIKPDDKEFRTTNINVREMCRTLGIQEESNYRILAGAIKGLADKSVWVLKRDETGVSVVTTQRWIEEPIAEPGNFKVKIQDYWAPQLLGLREKKNYTTYFIQEMKPMKSIYGKRTYELLKSRIMNRKGKHVITFTVDEYRKLVLGIEDSERKYKDFNNFKRKVLDKAIEDMESYGEIKASYSCRKEGYCYKYIDFTAEMRSEEEMLEIYKKEKEYFENRF